MCGKAILGNGGTLESVPDCYKNKELCNKAFENYPYAFLYLTVFLINVNLKNV